MELNFKAASERLKGIVFRTPLQLNANLSRKFNCNVYLKREDLQTVRSYKIRGAYNKISSLSEEQKAKGVVCASAGNHAQGFALSCKMLEIEGVVFMPSITPMQKINQTKMFGGDNIEIVLTGDTYDDCAKAAIEYAHLNDMIFIHPFDDEKIIEGQGTVGIDILEELKDIDFVVIPIGGGGRRLGGWRHFKTVNPPPKKLRRRHGGGAPKKKKFER